MKKNKLLLILMFATMSSWLYAQDVIVHPNTNITIESGTTVDFASGNLVLESDATGDASLIDLGGITYSGGGETQVNRYLTEGKWHLISSPVSGLQAGMFLDKYLQFHTESTNNWTDISSEAYNLNTMQGFAYWSTDASPTTEVFSGVSNSGSYNKAFSQNGLGWNLMGNPYPSSIDWDAVTKPVEMNGAFWLFDPTIGANGDYVYYINGGGISNTTSQYIPSGQGFFVRATGGNGTFDLNNSFRTHSDQQFYKEAENDPTLLLTATGNGITTQTSIRFNENATAQNDRLYDVYKIITDSPEVPVLYTRSENEKMAINTLPNISDHQSVPVWFTAGVDENYTITFQLSETFDQNIPIYLEDKETGMIQMLSENPEYVFNYKTGKERQFVVHFANPDNEIQNSDVLIYANGNILNVNFPASKLSDPDFNANITVVDLSGKVILHHQTNKALNQIPVNIKNSICLVAVSTNTEVTNKKVFIK